MSRTPLTSTSTSWAPDDLLNTAEASEYLRLSISTLNKMRVYGTGPAFVRLGRSVRYFKRDLDAFITARRANSTADAPYLPFPVIAEK